MARRMIGGRPSKAALGRMKLVTIGVSIAAFLGGLGVISATGAYGATAIAQVQSSRVASAASTSVQSSRRTGSTASAQQPGFSAPLTRSRGS